MLVLAAWETSNASISLCRRTKWSTTCGKTPSCAPGGKTDREAVCREFGLSQAEIDALSGDPNPRVLMDLGVHQYLVPHILRLTYGESGMTNTHPALVAYQKAFPDETKAAIGGSKWDVSE